MFELCLKAAVMESALRDAQSTAIQAAKEKREALDRASECEIAVRQVSIADFLKRLVVGLN